MDVKESRTEPILAERSNDVTNKYGASGSAIQYNRNKPYQDIGSNSLAKVDVQTSRPCAVIGPDRIVPPPTSSDAYLKKAPLEAWPYLDTYHRPPEYPHKMSEYQSQTRNISPRQTFQENMQRVMVPPTFSSAKPNEDTNFLVDRNVSHSKNIKSNLPLEAKYCDVPYTVNPNNSEPKNRNTEMCVPNVNQTLIRSAPHGWPPGSVNVRHQRPYGAPESYQYPEYSNCAAPRPAPMPRTHRTGHDDPGLLYSDPYYHEANIRFKPYPTAKERYPQARYDYIGNYPGPFHPPSPFTPLKYDLQKPMPPHPYVYPQVPIKYLDSRVADPSMNGYQRPNQVGNINLPFRNHVIHPSYGPPPLGNPLPPKLHSYPDGSGKPLASSKLPYDNSKVYVDYENVRPKNYPVNESYYINDMTRSHHMKNQMMMPNYPPVNMHSMPPHPYYRKDNLVMKNYELVPHFNNMDGPMHNPLSRLPPQFSPSAIAISPSDSNTSNDASQTQGLSQEDCGYVSQSSTTSVRSMDSVSNRIPNDFRRFDYRYRHFVRDSPLLSKPENAHNNDSQDKKGLDVRQFLEMWKDGDDDNTENDSSKEIINQVPSKDPNKYETGSNQEQLYVLGLVNVPSEELAKYEHIQKVSKLPENIKGYNNIELLNQFEEVFDATNTNNISNKPIIQRDYQVPLKPPLQKQAPLSLLPRPISPLDVEAKISQSVIHKEVGCNFEIKPCSPEMLNVEIATPIQNMLTERVIEKVTNPLISLHSPVLHGLDQNLESCNIIKHQDHKNMLNDENKISSCKLISPQYVTNNNAPEPIKANYSIQDLESNSGICLASLPRLDNDMELNFPEVNQQFINANKGESVITMPIKNVSNLDTKYPTKSSPPMREKTEDVKITFTGSESKFSKLSKYRKNKSHASEIQDQDVHKNVQIVRTDSVIIKNPENIKNYDNPYINQLDSNLNINNNLNSQPNTPKNISQNFEDYDTNSKANEIAIDFSLNKDEAENLTMAAFDGPPIASIPDGQPEDNSSKENGTTSPSLISSRDNIISTELKTSIDNDTTNNFLDLDYEKYEDNHQLNDPNDTSLSFTESENSEVSANSLMKTENSEKVSTSCEDNGEELAKLIDVKDNDSIHNNSSDCELPFLVNNDIEVPPSTNEEINEHNNLESVTDTIDPSNIVQNHEKDTKEELDKSLMEDNKKSPNDQDVTEFIEKKSIPSPGNANLRPFEVSNERVMSNESCATLESYCTETVIKSDNWNNCHNIAVQNKDIAMFNEVLPITETNNSRDGKDINEHHKCLKRNICHPNKELFSPWIQKLLIHNEGFINFHKPNIIRPSETGFCLTEMSIEREEDKTPDNTEFEIDLLPTRDFIGSLNITSVDDKVSYSNSTDAPKQDFSSNNIPADDSTDKSSRNDKQQKNHIDEDMVIESTTVKNELIDVEKHMDAEIERRNLNFINEIPENVVEGNEISSASNPLNSVSDTSENKKTNLTADESAHKIIDDTNDASKDGNLNVINQILENVDDEISSASSLLSSISNTSEENKDNFIPDESYQINDTKKDGNLTDINKISENIVGDEISSASSLLNSVSDTCEENRAKFITEDPSHQINVTSDAANDGNLTDINEISENIIGDEISSASSLLSSISDTSEENKDNFITDESAHQINDTNGTTKDGNLNDINEIPENIVGDEISSASSLLSSISDACEENKAKFITDEYAHQINGTNDAKVGSSNDITEIPENIVEDENKSASSASSPLNSVSDTSEQNKSNCITDASSHQIIDDTNDVTKNSQVEKNSRSNEVQIMSSHDEIQDAVDNSTVQENNFNTEVITNSESNITTIPIPTECMLETSTSMLEENGGTNHSEVCHEDNVDKQSENESVVNKIAQNQTSKDASFSSNLSRKDRRFSLKRSLSDSALHEYNNENSNDSKLDTESKHFMWPIKRRKLNNDSNIIEPHFIAENFCNIIQTRRNSISSIYNEENVSFCILIDDNCIITEGSPENENYAEILEECLPVDQQTLDETTNLSTNDTEPEEREEVIEHLDSEIVTTIEESQIEESWVEDIAYTEDVVSDDIAEDIEISAPSSPKEEELSESDSDIINDIVREHTDKVKEIYGGIMCNDDAQFVETLCRMPQMNVNKTLTNRESHVTEECTKYYDEESLERVLSESNTCDLPLTNYIVPQSNSLDSKDVALKTPDDKENVNLENASLLDLKSNVLNTIPNNWMNSKDEEGNIQPHKYKRTQDDTIHSCESSTDNVFCYKDRDEITEYATSSSPEVSSTTSEDKKSSILLKIKSYKGTRISEVNDGGFRNNNNNKISCKYTEQQEYSSKPRPLLTKAAQKYIPPLKETIGDLKVKLPLPPHSLVKLKQLKITKNEPKIDIKSSTQSKYSKIGLDIVKKPKPKFEDVLKSIDEIQFKKHKEKKKVKKSVPKMVIKKTENGSHYASTSHSDTYNPDLTGRKWQPWVFLEKNNFIDKMALRKKTKAVFSHRKNTYVLAEKFRKYKSIGSAKFVISPPKFEQSCTGPLKYTIRLKHTY